MSAVAEADTQMSHPRAIALVEFLDSEYRRVVGSVAMITGDRASAEDAVNDAMVTAWTQRDRQIERLAAWITVAASNRARSDRRRRGAEGRAVDRLRARRIADVDEPQPLDDALAQALRDLPRREREVAVLHYVLDLSVADTAVELGIGAGTVKTLLSRARGHLAAALAVGEERA